MGDGRLLLHGFFRSSTALRVRIALNLKGLDYDQKTYVLRAGEQRAIDYLNINPQGLVPALARPDGTVLTQSLAIIEWLDEIRPDPPLLPQTPDARARVRELAHIIALDVHPINNLRVLNYLQWEFGAGDDAVKKWFGHWVALAFEALEKRLASDAGTGRFCHGDTPSLADICLVAQSINNRRFAIDETPYPTIGRIVETCLKRPEFKAALPQHQPDATG